MPYCPNDDAGIADTKYDVLIEVTSRGEDAASIVDQPGLCLPEIGRRHIYRVEELVQIDRQNIVVGERPLILAFDVLPANA